MQYAARRARRLGATALLASAALVLSVLPAAGGTPTTGVWIFPHDHQEDAVADVLDETFYLTDNASAWVQDSFFADSLADSASVQVDLYNPTGTDLSSLNVFAAINDADLFTSISFSGGDGGDVSIPASDLGGGTPFLPDGSTLAGHDVYPAFFVSYSVGNLPGGDNGLVTIWVNVSGDFAGGLIVHLDYAAVDAVGTVFTGPFEADMNILENGEAGEEPPCEDSGMSAIVDEIEGIMTLIEHIEPVIDFVVEVQGGSGSDNITLTVVFPPELTPGEPTAGKTTGQVWVWSVGSGKGGDTRNASVTLSIAPTVLDGDSFDLLGDLSWETCGDAHLEALEFQLEAASVPSGDVHSASWWQDQADKTSKGKSKAAFTEGEFDGFFQAIAAHSAMFTYGAWDGTQPNGEPDEGWLDMDSLGEALSVLKGKSGDSKKVGGLERQALALWLNVASGAVNQDTALKAAEDCDQDDSTDSDDGASDAGCKNHHSKGLSAFEQRTGITALGADFDSVGEILSFAEDQSADWKDGSGVSKLDLALARLLCKAVNRAWLVPA